MNNRIYLVFDRTKNSIKIKSILTKKIKITTLNKSNMIVVIGGDGFMLQTLKKFYELKKPFYGINSGNYGFLMNKFDNKNILKNLNISNSIKIHPLQMTVVTKKNQTKKSIAINEVSILRQSKQASSISIIANRKNIIKNLNISNSIKIYPLQMTVTNKNNQTKKSIAINEVSILRQSKQASSISITANKKNIIKNLISDGVLVSTPAGSTAYNLSVHGPILSLNSKKLSIAPISPFRPRRWKGKIVSDKSIITIKNLNSSKRPISAVADNHELRNANIIYIKTNKKIKFNLLFDKNRSLQKKIKLEQIRKETVSK